MGGVIDRPAPAGSGEELALSRVGGRSLPPSPNFTSEERATRAGGNGYPPTTRNGPEGSPARATLRATPPALTAR